MATLTTTVFDQFYYDEGIKVHDLSADTLKIALTNTAPNAATDTVFADITEITAGNGYTAGGEDVQNTWTKGSGSTTLGGTSVTWVASGGSIGPFRYLVLYNDTPTSPADPLICYYDYGSALTLADGESFKYNILTSIATLSS